MQRVFAVSRLGVVAMAAGALAASAAAQQARPDLTGMWGDPPATLLDTFCLFWCSDAGLSASTRSWTIPPMTGVLRWSCTGTRDAISATSMCVRV